ncbi:MAG: FAD-binding protein [Campylobacterales bacterium]|nr:FAD-binding protein [Campylobacterales bacterium]
MLVVSQTNPTNSQTCMAQGGMNAALYEDTTNYHVEDTLISSKNLASKNAVEIFCNNILDEIEFLDSIGMAFSRDGEKIAQRKLGGARNKRACYAKDYTGLRVLHVLFDYANKLQIPFLNNYKLLKFLVDENKIYGAEFLDIKTSEVKTIKAKSVILASGGYSGIFGKHSTNQLSTIGDGILASYNAGAVLSNLEFVQFHPTALKSSSILISESARGEGGYLLNSDNERFVNELLARDVVVKAIHEQLQKGKEVFLDVRHISHILKHVMPQELKLAKLHENIDIASELLPIKPAAHYSMGGVLVDNFARSSIRGLFAVGEASQSNIHGANRLGGNSLSELLVFGKIAVQCAFEYIKSQNFQDIKFENSSNLDVIFSLNGDKNFYKTKDELSDILYNFAGIVKNENSLIKALNFIENIDVHEYKIGDKSTTFNTDLKNFLEFLSQIELSKLYIKSAFFRKESRGSHLRDDFESENVEFDGISIIDKDKIFIHKLID